MSGEISVSHLKETMWKNKILFDKKKKKNIFLVSLGTFHFM